MNDLREIIQARKSDSVRRRTEVKDRRQAGRALYTVTGAPSLRESFVIYLDELGTTARLSGLTDTDLAADLALYDQLRTLLLDETSELETESARALYFSDNVAVATPLEERNQFFPDHGLYQQINAIVVYQLNMALRGRALRGGIAAGPAYADHSFITGPAHLTAVQLEEKHAINPRVLLDDKCCTILDDLAAGDSDDIEAYKLLRHFLLRDDSDGKVFVNYLRGIEEDGNYVEITQGLTEHRDFLADSLATTAENPRVNAKYQWAAGYHNYVCRTFYQEYSSNVEVRGVDPGLFSKLRRTRQ